MNQENYVIFKGTKDGVTVLFQPDVPFEELCTQLEQKVEEAGKFFDNVKTSLAFKGRSFTEEEEEKLLQIIAERTTMRITFHRGSLRNGQKIEFDGSVVVVGDVNPGAEIKATGNIIILGQLKGMAHAGCKGMTDAFVTAVYMAPVQLRIADIITRFPEENKHGPKPPEYAFVKDGQIFVMALS